MPLRSGDAALARDFEDALVRAEIILEPISQSVLRDAARLRAQIPGLKTPDAIHAVTALLSNCSLFITNDRGFRRVPNLPMAILDDVLHS